MRKILKININHRESNDMLNRLIKKVKSSVELNASLVAINIKNSPGETPNNIIEMTVNNLIYFMLKGADVRQLQSYISSGILFSLKDIIMESLCNHETVIEAVQEREEFLNLYK